VNCKNSGNEFISEFPDATKKQLESDILNPIKKRIIANEQKKLILNNFLLPLNSTENAVNYSAILKNSYYLNYKCKIDESNYLVSISENYGYLIDYNQYLGIYNSKEDKIKSVLLIHSSNRLKKISSKFYNNMIIIESVFKNNIDNGLDLNLNIDNSIKITEKYLIEEFFKKVE
jgi:hypothetical protein